MVESNSEDKSEEAKKAEEKARKKAEKKKEKRKENKKKLKKIAAETVGEIANIKALEAASNLDRQRDEKYLQLETQKRQQVQQLYGNLNQTDSRLVKAALIPRTGEQSAIIRFMFNPTDLQFSRSVSIQMMEGARTRRGLPKVNFGFVEPYQLTLAGLVYDTYEQGINVLKEIQPILDAVNFTKFQNPYQKGSNGYQERLVNASASNAAVKGLTNAGTQLLSYKTGINANVNTVGAQEYGAEKVMSEQALEIRRPPVYYFVWGQKNYLMCMIESLTYKLTMFLPDGTPVRALVDLTLKEVDLGVADRALSQRQTLISATT